VAVGIFAIGIVGVIALYAPVAKSVGDVADAEAAAHVAELLSVKLQTQEAADVAAGAPFQSLAARLLVSTAKSHQLTLDDASPTYDVATDTTHLLFASHDGTRMGAFNEANTWINGSADKFFEIALIRNETLSPNNPASDAVAPMIAYTARIRWPAFVPLAGGTGAVEIGSNPSATVKFDYSQKRVLFVTGAVTR